MKRITRCSTRHKDSPKGILLSCSGLCARAAAGREIHIPHPELRMRGQELQTRLGRAHTGRHTFHGRARGAEPCAPWDTLLLPQLPLPLETCTGSDKHPCKQPAPRGKQQETAQGLPSCQEPAKCSPPGAGHTASLAVPEPPCAQGDSAGLPNSLTQIQNAQTQWQLGPQNEHLYLKTTNKQKSPHNNKPHTHTRNHPEHQIQAEQILSALASCVIDTSQVSPCSWRGNT